MVRSPCRGERGFTITELLVALTVTVIGLAGLLSLHVATVRGNVAASRALEATSFAEESHEVLRSVPLGELELFFAAATTTEQYYFWDSDDGADTPVRKLGKSTTLGRNNQQYLRVVRLFLPESTKPNLVRVTVEIVWNDELPVTLESTAKLTAEGADHRLRIETLRTKSEAL